MQTTPTTVPDVPPPVQRFLANNATDPAAVVRYFTQDAVVVDERREHRGHAAIAAWNTAAVATYSMTTEVLAAQVDDAHTTVRARVSGTFPGSPLELRFRFVLKDDRIARLEIAP